MTVKGYVEALTTPIPQSAPLRGREHEMVQNRAGGYVFAADEWTHLDRFLVLGSSAGTYYAQEREHTVQATDNLRACIQQDPLRVVQRTIDVSQAGRAPRNLPAIVALALTCKTAPTPEARHTAYEALPQVCRTASDLFTWVELIQSVGGGGGWSAGVRRAVAAWYQARSERGTLALQLVKYRERNGFSHRDLLRLAHPIPRTAEENALYHWAARSDLSRSPAHYHAFPPSLLPPLIEAFEQAQRAATPAETAQLILQHRLPREAVRPEHLTGAEVWAALLQDMPVGAMVRNLGNLSKNGVVAPFSTGTAQVLQVLGDTERLRSARIHPMALLLAQRTYASGHGLRGHGTWTPVPQVVDALDAAFYAAMANVAPTGKRHLVAVDVSGSMGMSQISGYPLQPREAAAAMALITCRVEPHWYAIGFDTQAQELRISPSMRLSDAIAAVPDGGGTDCAVPIEWLGRQKLHVDVVSLYTDGETWAGHEHPQVAMEAYRKAFVPDCRYIQQAFTATAGSLADPHDRLALDIVGLDASAANLQRSFAAGEW